jgi:hypothetical protein
MADSGHQFGSGPVSYYSVYKGYLDAELARPAGAELSARASRIGNRFSVSVTLVNRSGTTLSVSNGATVHVIVYEDIKVGVRGARSETPSTPPSARRSPTAGRPRSSSTRTT